MYVGLVTRSRTPSAPHAPRTNVVLPEPSSPATVTTSPVASRRASSAASASVSSGDWLSLLHAYDPSMPAYVIVETDVHDPEQYERYRAASPGAVHAGGGRFVVRGGELAVLEGDWDPSRLVVLEFPDLEAAKRWYDSPEYEEAKRLREGAANLRMVAVQGLDEPL